MGTSASLSCHFAHRICWAWHWKYFGLRYFLFFRCHLHIHTHTKHRAHSTNTSRGYSWRPTKREIYRGAQTVRRRDMRIEPAHSEQMPDTRLPVACAALTNWIHWTIAAKRQVSELGLSIFSVRREKFKCIRARTPPRTTIKCWTQTQSHSHVK